MEAPVFTVFNGSWHMAEITRYNHYIVQEFLIGHLSYLRVSAEFYMQDVTAIDKQVPIDRFTAQQTSLNQTTYCATTHFTALSRYGRSY